MYNIRNSCCIFTEIAQKLALHLPTGVLTLRRMMEVMKMEGDPLASLSAHARWPRLDGAAIYARFLTASLKLVHRGQDPQA